MNLRTTTSSRTFYMDAQHEDPKAQANGNAPPPFYIDIHASVKSSTRPHLPVTLATWRTPLERELQEPAPGPGEAGGPTKPMPNDAPTYSPVWLESALTPFRSTADAARRVAPRALGLIACRRGGYPRDLRGAWDFVTLPPADATGEVTVRHVVPRAELRFHTTAEPAAAMVPRPGERFVVGPSEGGLGTFWWRWGDLEGDLRDRGFRSDRWWNGVEEETDAGREWIESEGDNGFGLAMEVENMAEVEFVPWQSGL